MVAVRLPHQDKTFLKSRQQYQHSSTGRGSGLETLGMPKTQSVHGAVPPNDGDCQLSHGSPHANTRESRTIDVARASFRRPAPRDWIFDRPTHTTDTKTDIVHRKITCHHHGSIAATRSSSSGSCHTAPTTKSSDSITRRHVATTPTTARISNRRSNDQMFSETDSNGLFLRSRTATFCGFPSRLVEYELQPKYRPTTSFTRGMAQSIPKEIRIQPHPTLGEIPNQVFIPPEPDDHSTSDVSLDELYGLLADQADDRTLTPHPSFDIDDTHRDYDDVKDFHYLYQSFLRLEAKELGPQNRSGHQNSHQDASRPEPDAEIDDSSTAGLLDMCWGLCMDLKFLWTRSWKEDFKGAMDTATFTFLPDPCEQEKHGNMKKQGKHNVEDKTSLLLNQTKRGRVRLKNSTFKSHNRWEWV
jgi:hypothetical protein